MLQFFRRYQKIFFYVVGFFVIFSFSFFGSFSTFLKGSSLPEKKIAQTLGGSFITDLQVLSLAHFLNAGQDCLVCLNAAQAPVLLNDGVILKDFIETGFAAKLFDRFEDSFKEEIKEKIAHAKSFRPYVHPEVPFLNQEAVWKTFHPELFNHIKQLRALPENDVRGGFILLMQLFKDQQALPSFAVGRVLMYQANQYKDLVQESDIRGHDFALFGFHTAQDWFGKSFVTAMARTIINGSHLARQEGISVDNKEIRQQLMGNVNTAYKKFGEGKEFTPIRLKKTYQDQMASLGLEEGRVLEIWRTISLFRSWLKKDSDKLFVDALAQEAFTAFAHEGFHVDLYELPEALQLHSFNDVAELEVYLEAISSAKKNKPLSLLGPYATLQDIAQKCPQLIYRTYEVEWSHVNIEKLGSKIPLKQIFSWQLSQDHWELMRAQFPYLIEKEFATEEDRFSFLEGLDTASKEKLDEFTKKEMVREHPEWVDEALELESPKNETWYLSLKGGKLPFIGIKDAEAMMQVLDAAYNNEETPLTKTWDQKHYYRFVVKGCSEEKAVMPFSLAKEQKVLKEILAEKISQSYPEIRKKNPQKFRKSDGSWKSVTEIQYDAFREIFSGLITELIEKAREMENIPSLDLDTFPLDLLAKYRLIDYVEKVRSGVLNPEEINAFSLFDEGWHMKKQDMILKRSSPLSGLAEEIFEGGENFVSPIKQLPTTGLGFFHVKTKLSQEEGVASAAPLRKRLCQEIEEKQFVSLLTQLKEEHVISEAP